MLLLDPKIHNNSFGIAKEKLKTPGPLPSRLFVCLDNKRQEGGGRRGGGGLNRIVNRRKEKRKKKGNLKKTKE